MEPGLGARLRAQRERQQVSLDAISKDTKIKVSMLEALENDDVSRWPEGIFRRAYVRAYARAIGLDPETVVREFLEIHPDPVVTPPETETELENPPWPEGFRRLFTATRDFVPSRRPRADETQASDQPSADKVVRVPEPSLLTIAELCTRLGRVVDRRDVAPILKDAASAVDAVGLVVWSWDSRTAALRPSLAYGYADAVLAQMPTVRADADNAIAATFRSAQGCVVNGGAGMTGAVVVPLMAHSGCVGVLALELRHGNERREYVRGFAAILAAQLVTLIGSVPLAEVING
jgi:hypothetical protein